MGAGGSAATVQDHLDKQELCIKKIQSALLQQDGRLPTGCYEEGEPLEDESDNSDYEDETELARMIVQREERAVDAKDDGAADGAAESKDFEWAEPTEEQAEGLRYTKPWLLDTLPPADWEYNKEERDLAPDASLELAFVYGYRTRCCRNTLKWVSDKTALYFAAKTAVVHDFETNTQKFFRGHTDNLVSLAYCPTKECVATGQQCLPLICVWDVHTQKPLAKLGGFHKKAVVSLSFSEDGKYLASVGLDDHHTLAVYDWEAGAKIYHAECGTRRVFGIRFLPGSSSDFITVGVKHLECWKIPPLQGETHLVQTSPKLGRRGKNQAFMDSSSIGGCPVVATAGGELYKFNSEGVLIDICYAHNGIIASLTRYGDYLVSGGQDGYACVWDKSFVKIASIKLDTKTSAKNSVRSLDCRGDQLLIGCITSSMYHVNLKTQTAPRLLAAFHCGDLTAKQRYGELWAVAEDPLGSRFATVCDDAMLRVWDSTTHTCVHSSSMSVGDECGPARSLCWSPDGKWIACGFLQGSVALFNTGSGFCEEYRIKARKRRIQSIRFSPCGKFLAVGGADTVVDVYNVQDGAACIKRVCECRGSTSVILSIDWSVDSQYIQISTQDYFLKFFSFPQGELVSAAETRNVEWSTQTSFLGWNVQGIWAKGSDGSDINALSKSHEGNHLATADEFGNVNLFRFPCVGSGLDRSGNLTRRPGSISESGQGQVTNVAWDCKGSMLYTSGGEDMTVFQWAFRPGA